MRLMFQIYPSDFCGKIQTDYLIVTQVKNENYALN